MVFGAKKYLGREQRGGRPYAETEVGSEADRKCNQRKRLMGESCNWAANCRIPKSGSIQCNNIERICAMCCYRSRSF
jgi:hypothetical protein